MSCSSTVHDWLAVLTLSSTNEEASGECVGVGGCLY
jgi:hypothetical protein